MVVLPDCSIEGGWKRGRVPREGYQRGWGLEFGDLADQITADALYQEAVQCTDWLTIMSGHRQMNIFLLITKFLSDLASQNIIEFGAYKGGNVLFMARLLKELFPKAKVYALDTFEGMPATGSIDMHGPGQFGDTNVGILERAREKHKLDNIVIAKGLFQDTFPGIAAANPSFGVAHIDCDIYSAVKYSQSAVWPYMARGGYVVFDDATVSSCLGATQAVEEMIVERGVSCEQIWPHFVFRASN